MRWIKRVVLGVVVFLVVSSALGYVFRDELLGLAKEYVQRETQRSISRYGSGLPPIDEVRLLHVEDHSTGTGLGTYRIPFYDPPEMFIVAEKTLSGDEAQEVARQWRALQLHTRYIAGCYNPHHVIQFRSRGRVICEAVACFGCGNTTIPGFPLRTLVSFEPTRPDYLRFKAIIEGTVGRHESAPRLSK
ncbi:hypothetical protein ACXR0O_22180 [Verrucomicrobiota bacterium sgz303538]